MLAHCNGKSVLVQPRGSANGPGGIATAPAIITGYLMWKYNWNFETALAFIQSKRYCVSPMSVG